MSKPKKGPSRGFRDEVWFAPNKGMQRNARAALALQERLPPSRRGGTAAGRARARSIARGELQPAREIAGWFARHGGYIELAKARGQTMQTSKALQSSNLWGGLVAARAARAWIRRAERLEWAALKHS